MEPGARGSALVVEDDASTRDLIARTLRGAGLEVVAVESGERVLLEAPGRYASFDVVVLDVHLPGMTGLDLASLIRARRPAQAIVLITGDTDPGLAREALARGPVKYLLKPFEMVALRSAVEQALESGRSAAVEAAVQGQGWLDLVETSYMGSGHARRVGRLTLALAEAMPGIERRLEVRDLLVAAWSHDLGRGALGDPVGIAAESARMLEGLGSAANVVKAVRHQAERYDGTGGPAGLRGEEIPLISQLVAVADALEHAVLTGLAEGAGPAAAVDQGLADLAAQRGSAFRPDVVDAARRQRERLIAICTDASMAGPSSSATVAA